MQATTQSIYQASTVVLNMESSGSATSHFFGTTLPYWPRLTHSNSSLALFRLEERENGTRASKRLSIDAQGAALAEKDARARAAPMGDDAADPRASAR